MTRKTIKVRIPAQTVEVCVEDWALAYGVDASAVREDVIAYFANICAEKLEDLGLGRGVAK